MLCEVFAVYVACAEYRALLQHQMQPESTERGVSASVPAQSGKIPAISLCTSTELEEEEVAINIYICLTERHLLGTMGQHAPPARNHGPTSSCVEHERGNEQEA